MENLFNSIDLFFPKIILGSILGIILSCLGIILVLRNMGFFCITLSQIATTSYAILLFFGMHGEFSVLILSLITMTPLLYLSSKSQKTDTLLGVLFVLFGAFSQLILSMGGSVKNHLLSAYFGDILTSEIEIFSVSFLLCIFSFLIFIYYYKKILFFSFDPDEYLVRNHTPKIDIIFLIIVIICLSVSVHLLGSFYSTAQILIPGFTGLFLFRSMKNIYIFSIIFSLLASFLGFFISLMGFEYGGEMIYFPTSSLIVTILGMSSFLLILFKKLNLKK